MSEEQKPEEQQQIQLPVVDSPRCIINNENGMAWIALPLEKLTATEMIVTLDGVKFQCMKWIKQAEKKPKLYKAVSGLFKQ